MKLEISAAASLLSGALAFSATAASPSDEAERRDVIEQVARLLRTNYVYPDRGRQLGDQIRREARADKWYAMQDPEVFAQAFTQRLREISSDGHLSLEYSAEALPPDTTAAETGFTADEFERWYGVRVNHGFEQVIRLEENIGYLDLRVFAPPSMAADVATAAMTLLAQSDALIIDLRKNGGGDGEMTHLLAAYLFDRPQPMSGLYDRPSDTMTHAVTPAWVPGRRFGARKPVYILVSHKTFSAAEAFAYDLQAAKRAVVIGETSGGGAHPFEYRRVGTHFVLSLPEGRSINPITGKDW